MSALGRQSRVYTSELPGVLERTLAEHAAIVDAIARGDAAAARAAMEAHIARVRDIALAPARGAAA
jgi:DNA-binding FadR family transcriptional regulator